jgi:DNA-binding IclR family transcriptional regulator
VETAWRTDARLVPPDTGTLMPMLASAMGRAWLSSASPADRETLLNQVRVRDRATWAAHAGAVRQSIEDFPRLRYCRSRAVRQDIEAFAAPLARPVDGVRYVMNCGVFAASPLHEDKARAIGLALAETVAGIDRLF